MRIWRRIVRKGGSRTAHTLRASRPQGTMGTVCRVALSLAGGYVEAPADARDCKRCAAKREAAETRGERIGAKVRRSLYDPGTRSA